MKDDWTLIRWMSVVCCAYSIIIILCVCACNMVIANRLGIIEAKIDALQTTQDQTVDFLSDIHAERAK